MDFSALIEKRRSIRKYRNEPIPRDTLEALKEAVLRAPTSRNRRPWRFIFVEDTALLEKLAEAKAGTSGFLGEAALGVVVTADETVSDVWIEDCSIASTFLLLAAENLGLGACWVQMRERKNPQGIDSEEVIRKILDLPHSTRITSIIAMGLPDEKKDPHPREELLHERIEMR